MSNNLDRDIFAEQPYGQLALKKMGKVPANFRLFEAAWLPEGPPPWNTMKVTGAEFRAAKTGPNKGHLTIELPGTRRSVYLDAPAIARASKKAAQSRIAQAK